MDLFLSYTKDKMKMAADAPLEIVSDYRTSLNTHLSNIKKRVLIDDNTLISIIAAINSGHNVILYGPPGTAKSTLSEFLPVELYGAKCNVHTADSEWNVRKVIGGITVKYEDSENGIQEVIGPRDGYIVDDIMECYDSRLSTTDFNTVFTIIDEFNRTNMDECMGPMFTAMGSDNKTLKLDYNKGFNDDMLEVQVPAGYRMICSMNKYDRTFTNELSEALTRRFKWIYVGAPDDTEYAQEESIVDGYVFGGVSSIKPKEPVNLVSSIETIPAVLFKNTISKEIFKVINSLREDLEIGTSYKIDSIRLAYYFFALKLYTIDWEKFNQVSVEIVANSVDVASACIPITDPSLQSEFENILNQIIEDTIDAALVMTIIPTCESLDDMDLIEKNNQRFSKYSRCTSELKRMKLSF